MSKPNHKITKDIAERLAKLEAKVFGNEGKVAKATSKKETIKKGDK